MSYVRHFHKLYEMLTEDLPKNHPGKNPTHNIIADSKHL